MHLQLTPPRAHAPTHPPPGSADIILDLVSTGVTLRENNLRQIEGGHIMDSQGVLVGNRRALLERPGLLEAVHELIERLEAHLTAEKFYSVIANMRGGSAAEVSERLLRNELLGGLQGPTVSPVFTLDGDRKAAEHGFYAAVVCVPKKQLYPAVKEIRKVRARLWGTAGGGTAGSGAAGRGAAGSGAAGGGQSLLLLVFSWGHAQSRPPTAISSLPDLLILHPPASTHTPSWPSDWRQRGAGAADDLHL